jgi:sec-independent protein translocase protein TatC
MDLAAVEERLRANGVEFISPPGIGGSTCRLPDGTPLDLIEGRASWTEDALRPAAGHRDQQGLPVLTLPYLVLMKYQIWAFVAPGLYRKEKRFAVPLLVSSILLFYVGMSFAYFAVFPVAFAFFAEQGLLGVQYAPEINELLNFVLATFFAFGIAFEVPVVVVLLAVTGLVSHEKLTAARGYVIIGVFVAAAVLTPPDPISQIMMAVPMWMLYEAGLVMARVLSRPARTKESDAGTGAA